jgi:hypothetical protein
MSRLFHLLGSLGLAFGLVAPVSAQSSQHDTSAAPVRVLRECTGNNRPSDSTLRCFESEAGWFLTNDTTWARQAIATVERSAAQFERSFGKSVGRGVVRQNVADQANTIVDSGTSVTATGVSTWVTTTSTDEVPKVPGARWTWSWMWMEGAGSLMQQLAGRLNLKQSMPDEFSVNAHELGHLWLDENYAWKPQKDFVQYGTPAADWLDETAAVLLEDSLTTEIRRAGLVRSYRAGSIKPLDTLFTMQHPQNELFASMTPADTGGVAAALERAMRATPSGLADSFYEQCRGLIDFLLERTDDPTIFGAIAANEANGSNMAEWLRTNGARYKLPTTVDGLEQEWQRWLAQQSQRRP